MNRLPRFTAVLLALVLLVHARPAAAQVYDNANIFTPATRDQANGLMADLEHNHGKQFVVETFASVPSEQQPQLQQDGKQKFFEHWLAERANALKVNGVYALICMDPRTIAVGAGRSTIERGDFTEQDKTQLRETIGKDFHSGNYDAGLLDGIHFVDQAYSQNIHSQQSESRSAAVPYYNSRPVSHGDTGVSLGMILCFVVGLIIVISLIRSVFYGGRGGYGGGGYAPPGPGYGAGYPPAGGYGYGPGYGGGSGFGRGFLGGLLGGALGGYAENRWFGGGNAGNAGGGYMQGGPPAGDPSGGFQPPSSSFDAGPSDAGQGFGDSPSVGDFSGGSDPGSGGGGDSGSVGGF